MIIGHRGAGKTWFLKKLTPFLKDQGVYTYHLDEEIEKKSQKSIKEIFKVHGEGFFRECEILYLKELVEKHIDKNIVIDVGAGFMGKKPKNFKALWLQRNVDLSEALFPDRPALGSSLKINDERFQKRQKKYHSMADYQLELCEDFFGDGLSMESLFKKSFLEKTLFNFKNQWFLTKLHKEHQSLIIPAFSQKKVGVFKETPTDKMGNPSIFNKNCHSSPFLEYCPQWELRDDRLPFSLIEKAIKKFPKSLISFRKKENSNRLKSLIIENSLWDWPLEWGIEKSARILSLHQRKENLIETLKSLPQTDQIIKLAVPIHSFKELKQAYEWFLENPEKRVFLPISKTGRWKWFRLLLGSKMPFGFLRESQTPYPDQPSLMDLLNHQSSWSSFMAILGDPVNHSLTPSFHRDFFNGKNTNCLAIELSRDEWDSAFPFLDELGLKACAVTSPLKRKAGERMEPMNRDGNFFEKTNVLTSPEYNNHYFRDSQASSPSNPLNTLCKLDSIQNEQVQKIQTALSESKIKKSLKSEGNQKPHLKKLSTNSKNFFKIKSSKNGVWVGTSTDEEGFEKLVSDIKDQNTKTPDKKPQNIRKSKVTEKDKKIAVWGGGDLLDMIKKKFPKAVFYSSRTGKIKPRDNWTLKTDSVSVREKPEQTNKRTGQTDSIYEKTEKKTGSKKPKAIDFSPDILIWAVGTKNFYKKGVYPPKSWKPEKLIDLNYSPDSPGLFCAGQYGCEYRCGLIYFIEQAKKQQEFWNECWF